MCCVGRCHSSRVFWYQGCVCGCETLWAGCQSYRSCWLLQILIYWIEQPRESLVWAACSCRHIAVHDLLLVSLDELSAYSELFGSGHSYAFLNPDSLDKISKIVLFDGHGQRNRASSWTDDWKGRYHEVYGYWYALWFVDLSEADVLATGRDTRTTFMIRNIPNKYSQVLPLSYLSSI